MSNFKYEIIVKKITDEDFTKMIKELEKLGYTAYEGFIHKTGDLITHRQGKYCREANYSNPRIEVPYNKDLILALAAAKEGDDFHVGEMVYIEKCSNTWASSAGGIYPIKDCKFPFIGKINNIIKGSIYVVAHIGDFGFDLNTCNPRKATKEEIIAHFSGKVTPLYNEMDAKNSELNITKWQVQVNNMKECQILTAYINNKITSTTNCGTIGAYYGFDEIAKVVAGDTKMLNNTYLNLSFGVWQEKILNKNNQPLINNQKPIKNGNKEEYNGSIIKVCAITPTITGGQKFTGNTVYGRKSKTATSIGHLGYSAVTY